MAVRGYHLGCPGWALKAWVGKLFPAGTRSNEFLERYAEVFNTVEGNTTFYALPPAETVVRWRASVPAGFRFCFKFPRAVTHEGPLRADHPAIDDFLRCIAPLADRIGTLFLQLPPHVGPAEVSALDALLASLSGDFTYAVEPRHPAFFDDGAAEHELDALLGARGIDRVIMDTRGIQSSTSLRFAEVRGRKPSLPVVMRATASQPLVRFVPHEDWAASLPFVAAWPAQVARWIGAGKRPYFFMHSPDDIDAPENAYRFHALVREHADVGEIPPWPGTPRQRELF